MPDYEEAPRRRKKSNTSSIEKSKQELVRLLNETDINYSNIAKMFEEEPPENGNVIPSDDIKDILMNAYTGDFDRILETLYNIQDITPNIVKYVGENIENEDEIKKYAELVENNTEYKNFKYVFDFYKNNPDDRDDFVDILGAYGGTRSSGTAVLASKLLRDENLSDTISEFLIKKARYEKDRHWRYSNDELFDLLLKKLRNTDSVAEAENIIEKIAIVSSVNNYNLYAEKFNEAISGRNLNKAIMGAKAKSLSYFQTANYEGKILGSSAEEILEQALRAKKYDEILFAIGKNRKLLDMAIKDPDGDEQASNYYRSSYLFRLFSSIKDNSPGRLQEYFDTLSSMQNKELLNHSLFEDIISQISDKIADNKNTLDLNDLEDMNLNSRSWVGKEISINNNDTIKNEQQILMVLNAMVDISFSGYKGSAKALAYWQEEALNLSQKNAEKALMYLLQVDRQKKQEEETNERGRYRYSDDPDDNNREAWTYRRIMPILAKHPKLIDKYMPIVKYYINRGESGDSEFLTTFNAINRNPALKDKLTPLMVKIKGENLTNLYLENTEKLKGAPMQNSILTRLQAETKHRAALFLDEFTGKIRNIAMNEFGQNDHWESIGKALENPEYRKRAESVYKEMLTNKEKCGEGYYGNGNNAFIRKQFPELVAILENDEKYKVEDLEREITFVKNYKMALSVVKEKRMAFDIAEAGVSNPRQAMVIETLFDKLNDRPNIYGSSYNKHYPATIAPIAAINMQEWMYKPVLQAIDNKKITADRLGSVHVLFDACKAWQFSPHFRKKDAVHVGKMPLVTRMIAGSVMDKIYHEANSEEKDNIKLLSAKFWDEMKIAQDMGKEKALDTYLRNTKINRKRILYARYGNRLHTDEMKLLIEQLNIKTVLDFKVSAFHKATNVLYDMEWQEKGYKGNIYNELRQRLQSEKDGEEVNWMHKTEDGTSIDLKRFYDDRKDWLVRGSVALSQVFGKTFPDYLRKTKEHINTHDAVYWLPTNLTPKKNSSLAAFLHKNIIYSDTNGKKLLRNLEELEVIAKNWEGLKPEEENQTFRGVLNICRSRKYDNQKSLEFAGEAAKWGVDSSKYQRYENIYLAGKNVPEPFDRNIVFEVNGLKGRFLPRDDVRAGFFGNYTGCCQHFDGAGSACAISSIKDPFSQCFVIENSRGEIVAGSWVWENKVPFKNDKDEVKTYRTATFDNIEAKQSYSDHDSDFAEIYMQVGQYLSHKNYRKVTIGKGGSDISLSKFPSTDAISLPKGYTDYSDANSQVLLSENVNAMPINEKEGRIYISGASQDDISSLETVAKKCFPDGSQDVSIPDENPQAFILRDIDKGIVGYVIYSNEEKYISDMAVLPEYRKDENMSSKKLLDAMMNHIAIEGGEWNADLRDKTSLVYMLLQAKRGVAKITNFNEIEEYTMSGGDKVYNTKFEFVSVDKRIETAKENEKIIKVMEQKVGKKEKSKKNRNIVNNMANRVRNLITPDNLSSEPQINDGFEPIAELAVERPRRMRRVNSQLENV